jgi:prepilin-type processing-associated H-X9-DG protein
MAATDDDALLERDTPPAPLNYASPADPEPFRFAGPVAALAVVAAVVALMAVLVTWTDGVAPKGRVVFLLFPLAPVVLGALATLDARATPPARRRARRAIWFGAAELGLMLVAAAVMPNGPSEQACRLACSANLRQLGQALQTYSIENAGVYPASFEALLHSADVAPRMFVCPSTDDVPADGASAPARMRGFQQAGHCSFVYVFDGSGADAGSVTARHVLVYERLSNHRGGGMNVLYGDGTVTWLDKWSAEHLVAELQAGHNPPRPAR